MKGVLPQILLVVTSVERVLKQIDRDPLSPTFGCVHLAYWRDKTSDVADMRRQEIMFPLALLYSRDYPGSEWKGNEGIRQAIEALLSFWCRNQYSDGSLDEWYKGERAFAAAAFSTHAVARTIETMGDSLNKEFVDRAKEKLEKTAYWLVHHNDLFKTNHQAVGVAALAWAGAVLKDNLFKQNAYKKLQSIIEVQTEEGWFPEIGHMDVGYTFLTVEFISMAMGLWDDWSKINTFQNAFEFACEWVHPDLTIGEEYGVCHNTYLSLIAVILMSRYSKRAAYLRRRVSEETLDLTRFSSYLTDDLRLLRWAYQPLLAYDYDRKTDYNSSMDEEPIPLQNPECKTVVYDKAAIVRFVCRGYTGVFSAAAGGLLRLFGSDCGKYISDYGYAVRVNNGYAANLVYNSNIRIFKEGDGAFGISCPISPVKKFMPRFLERVALRLACTTSIGSRVSRKLIDVARRKRGTSLNQASANLGSSKSLWNIQRDILVRKDHLIVKDQIVFKRRIKTADLFFLESVDGEWMKLHPLSSKLSTSFSKQLDHLEIIKIYRPKNNWRHVEISVNRVKV